MKRERAPNPFPLSLISGNLRSLMSSTETEDGRKIDVLAETVDGLIDALKARRTRRDQLKREDVRYLTYALVWQTTRDGEPLSGDHLRLLAASLGIRRDDASNPDSVAAMPGGAAHCLGLPKVHSSHYTKLLETIEIDARELDISTNELAKRAGVSRKTVDTWRKMKAYRDRVALLRGATVTS